MELMGLWLLLGVLLLLQTVPPWLLMGSADSRMEARTVIAAQSTAVRGGVSCPRPLHSLDFISHQHASGILISQSNLPQLLQAGPAPYLVSQQADVQALVVVVKALLLWEPNGGHKGHFLHLPLLLLDQKNNTHDCAMYA